jgi:hypothetical protein
MLYNGANPFDAQKARVYLEWLISHGKVFEQKAKEGKRSLPANAYLHVILAYFASQKGYTTEWVKQKYYKIHCNPDLFVRTKDDAFIGKTKYLRSSADLTKDEMSLSIERFRNWSAQEAGLYIPSSEEHLYLVEAQQEIERNKVFLS